MNFNILGATMADKVVYSTDPSFCVTCGSSPCRCPEPPKPGKSSQPYPARLSFVRGAKGSGVTRLDRLIMSPNGKEEMLKRFKARLGCGGAIKEGALEMQGDHRDFLEAELVKEGYKVKRIGG